jgi:hypothetical protein
VSTKTIANVEIDPVTGRPRLAHIVAPNEHAHGPSRITEARVLGQPLTALCGWVLVPSRNGAELPLCGECADLFEEMTGETSGFVDA